MTISHKVVGVVVCIVFVARTCPLNGQTADASTGVQPAVGAEGADEVTTTSWFSMPKVTMPKITMPKLSMPKLALPKWPTNSDGIAASPFAPISAGANKVTEGTKKAWEGTKEMFSFGGDDAAPKTRAPGQPQAEPSLWQRLTGKQPEPTGPQTVGEWMSQPRLNP